MSNNPLTYNQALHELEEILRSIESADTDIDTLASKVTRAAELIKFCRGRLQKVESEVKEIL
ncbi:MAG: exodeoxyribonuclease VII small subunit, partial [Tidjanibacter sp.]|nr:exodeoxyribonuclease VII small subunit [Tidjanibacter sp.]